MAKGEIKEGYVRIKHLDSPNITTYVDGKAIHIKNHEAIIDIPTAKKIMEGPWGYELVDVYDDFIKYVNEISIEENIFTGKNNDSDIDVAISIPLAGHKVYSWDKLSQSFLSLSNKEITRIIFTVDEIDNDWVKTLEKWADKNKNSFRAIHILKWDHNKEKAWNRVFKITVGRQLIFNLARTLNSVSHIWFVDSDIIHRPNDLQKLLSHNTTHVAGLYNFKSIGFGGPVVFNAKGNKEFPFNCLGDQCRDVKPETGTAQADWTGAGSLLLSREIYMDLNFDWSKWIQRHGEDAYICLLAQKKTGNQTIVDTNVHPEHLDEDGKGW